MYIGEYWFSRVAVVVAFGGAKPAPVSKKKLGWGAGRHRSSSEIMYEALGAIYLGRDVPDRVDGVLYRKEGT